jgi:hypothetical protein
LDILKFAKKWKVLGRLMIVVLVVRAFSIVLQKIRDSVLSRCVDENFLGTLPSRLGRRAGRASVLAGGGCGRSRHDRSRAGLCPFRRSPTKEASPRTFSAPTQSWTFMCCFRREIGNNVAATPRHPRDVTLTVADDCRFWCLRKFRTRDLPGDGKG